jgi:hypothetical protein
LIWVILESLPYWTPLVVDVMMELVIEVVIFVRLKFLLALQSTLPQVTFVGLLSLRNFFPNLVLNIFLIILLVVPHMETK